MVYCPIFLPEFHINMCCVWKAGKQIGFLKASYLLAHMSQLYTTH